MAQKAIREYDAKKILQERWGDYFGDTVGLAIRRDNKEVTITEARQLSAANF